MQHVNSLRLLKRAVGRRCASLEPTQLAKSHSEEEEEEDEFA